MNWTIPPVPSTRPDHQTRAVVVVPGRADHTPPCLPSPPSPLPRWPISSHIRAQTSVLPKMSVAVRSARGRLSLAEEKDGRMWSRAVTAPSPPLPHPAPPFRSIPNPAIQGQENMTRAHGSRRKKVSELGEGNESISLLHDHLAVKL